MELAETLTQIVTYVSQAWDEAGTFRVAIALIVPVIAWVIRKPVANLLFKLSKVIAKGVGFTLGEQIEESVRPAIEVFVVAFGALIAHESIQMPEPYFGIVGNLIDPLVLPQYSWLSTRRPVSFHSFLLGNIQAACRGK